jgi:hypothetical protein
MSTPRFPSDARSIAVWEQLYEDALLEFDNAKLRERISQARHAIHDRAKEILSDSSDRERERLANALQSLQILEQMEKAA